MGKKIKQKADLSIEIVHGAEGQVGTHRVKLAKSTTKEKILALLSV